MRHAFIIVLFCIVLIASAMTGVFLAHHYAMPALLNAFPTLKIDRTPRKYFDPLRFDNHAAAMVNSGKQ